MVLVVFGNGDSVRTGEGLLTNLGFTATNCQGDVLVAFLNENCLCTASRPIRDDDSAWGVVNLDTPPGPSRPSRRTGTGSASRLTRPARVARPSRPTGVTRSSSSSPTSGRSCPSDCDDVCFLVLIDRDAVSSRERLLLDGHRGLVSNVKGDAGSFALVNRDGLRPTSRAVRNLDSARD